MAGNQEIKNGEKMSKIAFAGHSVVKGTGYGGVQLADTFAYKIGAACGYAQADIYNAGASGDTSAGLLARFDADVLATGADVVVVMIGANDWINGVSVANFTANLRAIANKVVSASRKLVLFTDNMNRGSAAQFVAFGAYQDAIRKIALEFNAPLIEIFARMCFHGVVGDHAKYYANTTDTIHFSVLGHAWATDVAIGSSPKSIFLK